MSERFSYKTLGPEQTEKIVDVYRREQSCLRTSMQEGVYASPATISRVIQTAVCVGVLSEIEKQKPGGSADTLLRAIDVIQKYPLEKRRRQAALAGCSEATIYRAIQRAQNE